MNRRSLIAAVLIIAISTGALIVSGTLSEFTNDGQGVSTPMKGGEGQPTEAARMDISPRELHQVNNTTQMEIWVDINVFGHNGLSYEDVQLCLYDENGTVVGNHSLGTVSSPTQELRMFNVTVSERPTYYIIHHPRINETSTLWAIHRKRNPEDGVLYDVTIDEIDFYPLTNETGVCA